MPEWSELQQSCLLETSEFARAVAVEREEENDEFDGCLGYENDKIWNTELIWSEKDMSELNMKPRLRAEVLTGMISLLKDKFVRSENH